MVKIKKIVEHFGLDVLKITDVPESYSSEVHILTMANKEKVVLKIPYNQTKFQREKKILELLQGVLPVPEILDCWTGDEKIAGAFLLSYLPGQPASVPIGPNLAFQMGEMLGRIHTVPMECFQLGQKENWWDGVKVAFENWIPDFNQAISGRLLEESMWAFEELTSDLPPADGPCLIHFDYRPGNILVQDNKIQGIIDFESARGGSADIDFTKSSLYVWPTAPGNKEAFLQGYQKIRPLPPIDITLPLYYLFNAFGGIVWCYRRHQMGGEFFQENLSQLKEVIDQTKNR